MSEPRQKIQLELALRGAGEGEARLAPQRGTESLMAEGTTESPATERIMEEICEAGNLTRKIHQACAGSERGAVRSARRRKSQVRGGQVSFLAVTGLAEAVKRLWGRARDARGPARHARQVNRNALRAAARSGHASACGAQGQRAEQRSAGEGARELHHNPPH